MKNITRHSMNKCEGRAWCRESRNSATKKQTSLDTRAPFANVLNGSISLPLQTSGRRPGQETSYRIPSRYFTR